MTDLSRISTPAAGAYARLMQSWGAPLPVTSGYRSPEYNAKVGGAKNSQHLHGNAYDISTSGLTQAQQIDLINKARASGFGGIGVYDNSLHFDVGAPRAWGSDYTSKTLPSWAASALGSATAAPQMQNGGQQMADQPMGLLAQLGLQKRDPNATGETAMPFMQRDSFKNTMGNLAIGLNSMRLNPDPNIATIVSNQMQSRKDQQMANKTSQWLMQQPNGQAYVQLIEAGASPSTALSQYQTDMRELAKKAQPKPIEYKEVNGRLVAINPNDNSVKEVYGAGSLTNDQVSQGGALRDDLRSELGTFNLVRSGYQTIQDLYANSGSVSDYALAVGFAKILDPTSVAREGEVSAIAGSGSLESGLRAQIINALNGQGSLPPEVRTEIARIATMKYEREADRANTILGRYKIAADQSGVPFEQVWLGGDISPAAVVTPQGGPRLPSGSVNINGQTYNQSQLDAAWPNLDATARQAIMNSIGGTQP
jgi:hypothetical protein